MLSDKIAALAAQIEEHRTTGLTASAEGVERMVSNLREMAEDAEQLERTTRPVAGLGGTAQLAIPKGGVVVRLMPA